MRQALRPLLLATLTLLLGACHITPDGPTAIRIGSYNIHHGAGTDGVRDLDRIADALASERIDLIALQEVDRLAERSGRVDQAKALGASLGFQHVFGRSIPLGDGEYGNAVLSRWPIRSSTVHALPNPSGGEQRTVLEVLIEVPDGRTVTLLATHFDHSSRANRMAQAEWVIEHSKSVPGAVVLLGDLNAEPGSSTMTTLATAFEATDRTGFTYPAGVPDRRIDWILPCADDVAPLEDRVVPEPVASDHRPLWLDVEIQ